MKTLLTFKMGDLRSLETYQYIWFRGFRREVWKSPQSPEVPVNPKTIL